MISIGPNSTTGVAYFGANQKCLALGMVVDKTGFMYSTDRWIENLRLPGFHFVRYSNDKTGKYTIHVTRSGSETAKIPPLRLTGKSGFPPIRTYEEK